MTLRQLGVWAGVLVGLLAAGPAQAQPDSSAAAAGAPTSGEPDREAEMNARRLFEAGRAAFEAERYEDALAYFERAHTLSQRAQLLYNVGIAAERLGYRERAIAAFEAFLASAGDAPNRAEVESRLEILRRAPPPAPEPTADAEPEPPAVVPEAAVADDAPERDRGPLPAVLLASGGAASGAGLVLVGLARRSFRHVEDAPDGTPWSARSDDWTRARGMAGAAIAALGVGVAAATVGVVLMATGPASDDRTATGRAVVQVALAPDGVRLRGRF